MGTLRAIGFSAVLAVLLAALSFGSAGADAAGILDRRRVGLRLAGICDGCDRVGAPSGYLKLGGTLRQNILLGVETNGWTKSEAGARLTMGNVSGAIYWYPMTTNGMFVKAGAGYSVLDNSFASDVGLRVAGRRRLRRPG